MKTTKNTFEDFPDWVLEKWQNIADLLAETIGIPAALIMKTEHEFMEVYISSQSENNPYQMGLKDEMYGHYCETVLRTQQKLMIPNATKDSLWDKNPDIALGMIAYLGFPINYPDNQPFGTLCVLDNKERMFNLLNEKLILQFKNVIELDLALLQSFELKTNQLAETIVLETTKRKQTEQALRESEEKYRMLSGEFAGGVSLFEDNKVKYVSDGYLKILGYEKDEIFAISFETIFSFIHKDDVDRIHQTIETAHQQQAEKVQYRFRAKNKQGNYIWMEDLVHMEYDGSGNHFRSIIHSRDITERKHAEEVLIASEKRFRTIFENSMVGKSITYLDGRIKTNRAFCNIVGYSEKELSKLKWQNITHPEDVSRDQGVFQTILSGKKMYDRWEKRYIKKTGDLVWVDISTTLQRDKQGQPVYFITSILDVTDRKLAEQELIVAKQKAEESDRLKTSFLANMSHEIRTPMNGILGFAALLKTPGLSGEQQQEYIKIIEKSGDRMLNIINEIVEISKIEAGSMKIDLKDTDVNETLEFLYDFFKPEAEARGLNLIVRKTLPTNKAILNTDPEKLYAILTNLVKNALKYSDHGFIEFGYKVVTENDDAMPTGLQFYVKDTGIGIPKERQEAIFERFIQADIANIQARQGAGLGLSIAKAYVQMLGGILQIESEVGIGSTFHFTLPYTG